MANIKNFLKNKNTVTILGVIACIIILYAGYTMRINSKTKLVDVYYAKSTIQPKTLITEDMIARTSVPESFIKGAYYRNYNDILGKYSNYNSIIAAGSLFYSDLLIEEENLPDSMFYNVNDGERVAYFAVNNTTTYGNSMMPGNKIDIYVKYINENEKVIYGELFDKVEILAVKDTQGNNVFETNDEKRTPAYIYFSIPEAKYLLFSALNYVKEYNSEYEIEVVPVPNNIEYKEEDYTATEVTSDDLYNFVLKNISQIDTQRDLYNDLVNEMEQLAADRKKKAEEANNIKENNQNNEQNQNNE